MDNLTELLRNNARFAATDVKDRKPAIPFVPHKQLRQGFAARGGSDEHELVGPAVPDPVTTVRSDGERSQLSARVAAHPGDWTDLRRQHRCGRCRRASMSTAERHRLNTDLRLIGEDKRQRHRLEGWGRSANHDRG